MLDLKLKPTYELIFHKRGIDKFIMGVNPKATFSGKNAFLIRQEVKPAWWQTNKKRYKPVKVKEYKKTLFGFEVTNETENDWKRALKNPKFLEIVNEKGYLKEESSINILTFSSSEIIKRKDEIFNEYGRQQLSKNREKRLKKLLEND